MTTPAIVRAPQGPVSAVLDGVLVGLETVRVADRTTAADTERLVWVEKLIEAERRVSALKAVLIGEADEAGSAMRAVHTPLQDWLARSGQDTPRQAVGAVWRARELEQRPRVRDAAASGRISLGQAAAINQALNGLPTALDSAQRRKAEDLILTAAAHMPAEKLRNMSDRLIDQLAPLLTDTPEQRAERLEARDTRARARRCLRFGPEIDGSIDLSGSLPVVDGRRLQQMVQRIADRAYRAAKDTRNRAALSQTPQQRLADALVTVSKAADAVESASPSGGSGSPTDVRVPTGAAQLMVVIPYGELLDRATGRGLLMDGTPVSPGELRRLACSADLIPVVLDAVRRSWMLVARIGSRPRRSGSQSLYGMAAVPSRAARSRSGTATFTTSCRGRRAARPISQMSSLCVALITACSSPHHLSGSWTALSRCRTSGRYALMAEVCPSSSRPELSTPRERPCARSPATLRSSSTPDDAPVARSPSAGPGRFAS